MSLALGGLLDLNSRVRSVLGDDLELIDSAVTVEHLLTHTSGIGDYLDEPEHEMSARQLVSPEEFRTALFWGEEKTAGLILEQVSRSKRADASKTACRRTEQRPLP
jgi:CubicO group peptidase (beta-lactamase class C family)